MSEVLKVNTTLTSLHLNGEKWVGKKGRIGQNDELDDSQSDWR